MPKKSVREMSKAERRFYSIENRVFHATIQNCILIGLAALIIGLGFYTLALTQQMTEKAFNVCSSASISATHGVDSAALAEEVMGVYNSLTPEEQNKVGTDEYRARFAYIEESIDHIAAYNILNGFRESNDLFDVYLAMYDRANDRVIYIADSDNNPETHCEAGFWEPISHREIEKFFSWDGEGELYYIGRTDKYGWLCTAGVPIKNKAGETACFLHADIALENVVDAATAFVLQFAISILLLTALIAWFSTRKMRAMVVEPINKISEAAQHYAADRRSGASVTEHFSRLNIRTGDEIENLSLVMADMERDIDYYMEDITAVTTEKARMSTELDMAAQIQYSMLPHIFPPYPERREFDIFATMEPAKEVGGDFYDFFLIDKDHLCLVMADVSGKGVPASLFMMVSKVILQSFAMLGLSVEEIMNRTNEALCKDNQVEMFVTCWIGILEISTGKLSAVNAGHEYPAVKLPEEGFRLYKDLHGCALGGFDDEEYSSYELQLKPGSMLFFYTDGVPEAMDADRNQFGLDRMLEALNNDPDAAPEKLLADVRGSVSDFVKTADQFDDITMLCLKYNG